MSLITRMLKQDATYWALGSSESAGTDFNNEGNPVYAAPVEIKCRWEDRTDEYIDRNGTTSYSRSVVFVDRDVVIGGVLMLGTLDSGATLAEMKESGRAWEIQGFEKVPDLRIKNHLRVAYL